MADFNLKYGNTSVSVSIPEERIVEVVEGAEYPAIENPKEAFIEALDHPVGTKALKDIVTAGESVCIVVSDITRAWIGYDRFLPWLLNYLNDAGIPDSDIFLLVGYGAHRLMNEAECRKTYGEEAMNRVRLEHSTAISEDCHYREIGTTSNGVPIQINELALDADRLILTGGLVYHLLAGYGGGRKGILPAIASYKSIQGNHSLGLADVEGNGSNPLCVNGATDTNPFHRDQMEFGEAVNPDFLINIIDNAQGKLAKYVTGHWEKAWLDGIKVIDQIYGVPIQQKADCVIATSGGYPKDINLYQGVKTQTNACTACRLGGVVILLMELEDIGEPAEFIDWFKYSDLKEREQVLRKGFTIPGYISLRLSEDTFKYHNIVVTKPENKEIIERTGMTAAETLEEALQKAEELLGTKDFTVTVMPQAANTLPVLKG